MITAFLLICVVTGLAFSYFREGRRKLAVGAMQHDLRALADEQANYAGNHGGAYATDFAALKAKPSPRVAVVGAAATESSWWAILSHADTTAQCGYTAATGMIQTGRLVCGEPTLVQFTVKPDTIPVGAVAEFDASRALRAVGLDQVVGMDWDYGNGAHEHFSGPTGAVTNARFSVADQTVLAVLSIHLRTGRSVSGFLPVTIR